MISGAQSSEAFSNNGANHLSRPMFICISVCILLATNTVSTQEQLSSASSTIPFKSMVFAPL